MPSAKPGTVLHLSSGPKTDLLFRFHLTDAKTGAVKTMNLDTDVGWWLEGIVSEAQRRNPGATIVPDAEMLETWADVPPPSKDEDNE